MALNPVLKIYNMMALQKLPMINVWRAEKSPMIHVWRSGSLLE